MSHHHSTGQQVKRGSAGKSRALLEWEKREARLLANIKAVRANNTMQDEKWVEGQSRYFEGLLERHRKHRPAR